MSFINDRNRKLITCLEDLIYSDALPVQPVLMVKTDERVGTPGELDGRDFTHLEKGQIWGGHNEYYWFRLDVTVPPHFEGKTAVLELTTGQEGQWDATNPQFLVYINGRIKQGLDVNHREVILAEEARAGDVYRIELSAFTGVQNFRLELDLQLKVLHRDIEKYYYDLWTPYQVMELLEEESEEAMAISGAITESLNLLDLRREYSEEFYDSLGRAQKYIREEFYDKQCGHAAQTIYAVGHTHIDLAWLWTLAVTKDKAVRSFSTVLELMRQYPEYIFMSSQPKLYDYVKENAPEVYAELRDRIKEGRWEAEGGMYVEADCNLASGESLVRQFLYGKRYFKEEFGVDNEILWLPDVFGYSAALPQIMKKCGIRYFMTTKISWNETNKMPNDTFMWEGIDGTRILTHFISARDYNASLVVEGKKRPAHFTTYNGYLNPSQVKGTWRRYSQKDLNRSALLCYGYGDGGGGTTRDMLENQRRLAKGIPGCPRTKVSTALEFFKNLEKEAGDSSRLPRWVGELYLEYHRGTYTSMARNKKYNRKAEFLLHNVEFLSVLEAVNREAWNPEAANLGVVSQYRSYPHEAIDGLWKTVLKNQFHDILPGSSIKEVYEDSRREYEAVLKQGNAMQKECARRIAEQANAPGGSLIVLNQNGFTASGYVCVEYPDAGRADAGRQDAIRTDAGQPGIEGWDTDYYAVLDNGSESIIQKTCDGYGIFFAEHVPSLGYKAFGLKKGVGSRGVSVRFEGNSAQTEDLRVSWNKKGQFTSIFDKICQRELIRPGSCANRLVTYEDRPHNYDAWDINDYYREKEWGLDDEADIEVIENGPVRAVLRISRKYLASSIRQDIVFYARGTRIDVINHIDWKEKNILLRSYIPTDIHADQAAYEIQYGNVTRPTHCNTSWDQAKFEVCAHKWIDISEDGYGVSVLNDCKYGYDIHDGVIGLTMLKSAVYPNPDADKEMHEFGYSIVLHEGGWREGGTIHNAYLFNNPFTAVVKDNEGGPMPEEYSLAAVDQDNVVIETVKAAEAGDGLVLRMYEAYNRRTRAKLCFAKEVRSAAECSMLEEDKRKLKTEGNQIYIELAPYEIKTVKIKFK